MVGLRAGLAGGGNALHAAGIIRAATFAIISPYFSVGFGALIGSQLSNSEPTTPTPPPPREEVLFIAALKLPLAERAAFLDDACQGNAALRQRLEALLAAHEQEDALPATPLESSAVTARMGPVEDFVGRTIGRYKLIEKLGEGGCGVVYVAEQSEPVRRRVALKLIKQGMDTKAVIARFEAERQALALMDHPNIAKVLDGGTTDTGHPYFVMELVRGVRITEHCDQQKLSTPERVRLFVQVCQAVQHAHQKGIIHRDIKPSNVFVTSLDGAAVVKVIDFGIAKAIGNELLTDKTIHTALDQFIGTPAYMSPEQATRSGSDIDTRTDIYSLGVLLYELLTGRTPFDTKALLQSGFEHMLRIIREQEPPRPSNRLSTLAAAEMTTVALARHAEPPRLIHSIRGDLDWIAMKCLEKDRTRRYETASGLAADILRHLENEPIVARPPSASYRFQKMVRRNKFAVASATIIFLVLTLGAVISTWQAIRATRAERDQIKLRDQADANEKKARIEAHRGEQTTRFLKDMLSGVGPSAALGRDTTMLREILDKATKRVDTELKDEPEAQLDLRLTLARAYFDLEDYTKAEQISRETVALAQADYGQVNPMAADALHWRGMALMRLRDQGTAEEVARQSLAMQIKLHGEGSLEEASVLCNLGDIIRHIGKNEEAETDFRKALAIRKSHLGADDDDVAWALEGLSFALSAQRKMAEAKISARAALAIMRKVHGDDHPYTSYEYWCLGSLLVEGTPDEVAEAETDLRKAIAIQEKTVGKGKWSQAWMHHHLALALAQRNQPEEAETHFREALDIARKEGPDRSDVVQLLLGYVSFLRHNQRVEDARPLAEEAVALCRRHPNPFWASRTRRAVVALKTVLGELGDTNSLAKLNVEFPTRARAGRASPATPPNK
jgi:serine/threonine protein kinase/tetratricopeptide (TPR) repeat protein